MCILQILPEKVVFLFDCPGPFPIVRDGYNGTLLATFGKGVVHVSLEMITELLIGDVSGRSGDEYRILAFDLTDPVEENAVVLTNAENFSSKSSCPVSVQCLFSKFSHEVGKGFSFQRGFISLDPA